MACPICGNPIDFPVSRSTVGATGRIVSISTCTACSRYRHNVFFVDADVFEPQELAGLLTSISDFIRSHERIPMLNDISGLISVPIVFTARYGTERFTKQLEYLDAVVDFITRNDRIPLIEELGAWP